MSDEDRDVDIESDDDADSSKGAGGQFQTQAEKRAHHNALERKRRDHIKDSFSSLRDSVPALQGEKSGTSQSSRAQILKKAADYIQFMRRKNSSHQQDIDDLKRQNQLLETQIRALEKAKTLGTFNAASVVDTASLITNPKGDAISAFDGGSGSETSDSDSSSQSRRKKLKTESPNTSSSGT